MDSFITYEEALDELQKCERILGERWPCRLIYPTGRAPILAELQFGKDTGNLTVRLIDLDNGMWSFGFAQANEHGVTRAIGAVWYGPGAKSIDSLMFCVGCGIHPGTSCRHASGYRQNIARAERESLTRQLRQRLIVILQAAPQ